MTQLIFNQIMQIRDSGITNMLDCRSVRRIAFENGMYDLVSYIEEDPSRYFQFILYGNEPKKNPTRPNRHSTFCAEQPGKK